MPLEVFSTKALPFPHDSPYFTVSRVDVETGKTYINWDSVFKKDGERHIICAFNTKSYWPMAYHPGRNSLYVPYHDSCLDMTAKQDSESGYGPRFGIPRPGSDINQFSGVAKINMSTGQVQRIYASRVPGNGAALVTAGDLLFWGDLDRRFRAFDADTGKILWETILGGSIQMSTITLRCGNDGRRAVGHCGAARASARIEISARPQCDLCICFAVRNGAWRRLRGSRQSVYPRTPENG